MRAITGIIGSSHTADDRITTMTAAMVHEQGQQSGVLYDRDCLLHAGWVSLCSGVNGSAPMWNDKRDVCLLCMGEHFETESPSAEVGAGRSSVACRDGSTVIRMYEKRGAGCFRALNGNVSGVLVDKRRREVFLFNDRFGLSRIYYRATPNSFFFASEAKALLKVCASSRELDTASLGEFFSFGCVLQDRSLYRKVGVLPPASVWRFRQGRPVEKRRYLLPEALEELPALAPCDYNNLFRKSVPPIVKRYVHDDDPVAMSLTGGLDGRMVMASQSAEPGSLPCYTFNGPYRLSADTRIAAQIARQCHQPHHVIRVDEEFMRSFPTLAEETVYLTDGAMDVSGAAELYVNRVARGIAPVRLTGNYGSEMLRGTIAFRPSAIHEELFQPELVQSIRQAVATYNGELRGARRTFIAFKQMPWHHSARFSLERSQIRVRSPFLDNDLVRLAFQSPDDAEIQQKAILGLIADGDPALSRIPTNRGLWGDSSRRITVRRIRGELSAKAEYLYDYGMPQWLARADRAMRPFKLERLLLGRQKFCHFRVWYRDSLSSFVKDILLDPGSLSRSYLRRPVVEKMVRDHVTGRGNFTVEIHKLAGVELIHRLLLKA